MSEMTPMPYGRHLKRWTGLSPTEQRLLELLYRQYDVELGLGVTIRQIVDEVGITSKQARGSVENLLDQGLAVKVKREGRMIVGVQITRAGIDHYRLTGLKSEESIGREEGSKDDVR